MGGDGLEPGREQGDDLLLLLVELEPVRVRPPHQSLDEHTALRGGSEQFGDRRPVLAQPLIRIASPVGEEQVVTGAQLLHFGADLVRPQGRSGGGMAGVRVAAGERVVERGDNSRLLVDRWPGADAGLSVREAESLVKRLNAEFNLTSPRKPPGQPEKSGDVRRVEEELSDLLLAQVEVRVKRRAKRGGRLEQTGELAIQFGSLDELNGLIERLRAQ